MLGDSLAWNVGTEHHMSMVEAHHPEAGRQYPDSEIQIIH